MTRPTINDIAKALGITPSTVSRALAGNTRVSTSTRLLVERKAAELGYERNILASSLRKGVSDTVGMIVPRINRQFFSNAISGAEAILNPAGYNLLICQSHERLEDEKKALQTLTQNQVAGIIMSHSLESVNSNHVREVVRNNIKLIQFDRVFSDLSGAQIINDNFTGAFLATKHLIKNGYKRIGTLTGGLASAAYRERLQGYKSALESEGFHIDNDIIFPDTVVRDLGFDKTNIAIERGCDALYCAGDYAALGALECARSKALNVPADFGIVGTANENFTELMTPSISTLELNAFDMGNHAAQAFLDMIASEHASPISVTIPMRLIIRQTSVRKPVLHTIANI